MHRIESLWEMPPEDTYSVLLTDEELAVTDRLDKQTCERAGKKIAALCTLRPARSLKRHANVRALEIGDDRTPSQLTREKRQGLFSSSATTRNTGEGT